jgi:L-threonylcarbamoyladenylate synthase
MVSEFEACIRAGGVAIFPADTVYGLACDAEDADATARLYALKGREGTKPSAVMFFDMSRLPPMDPRTDAAARKLLPGGVTLLIPNPEHRFPVACGDDPDTLGIRIPADSPLAGAQVAVLQSSANHSGKPDPKTLDEIPADIRAAVSLELDAGELPGAPSTVIDLRSYEQDGKWGILRQGAVSKQEIDDRLRC